MQETPNLKLPYIIAAQAQKHVTHNEAIRALDAVVQLAVLDRDLLAPPASPADGERYIPAAGATGAWSGQAGSVATFQDGGWVFHMPREGWLAWVVDENALAVWSGAEWVAAGTGGGAPSLNPVTGGRLGINTTADATNRLAVKSDATLFSHDDVTPGSGDMRQVLNKQAAARTVSQLYQTGFSGRAETGLTGDDDFRVKVSPDGATWRDAIVVDRATGAVTFPNTTLGGGGGGGGINPSLLVNGDFQINQRAFAGGALAAGVYGFDRWKAAAGGANATLSGYVLTLASGELEQVVERALWGVASFASLPVTVSVEAPSHDLTVTFGSQSGTITAGSGRRAVTLTPGAGDTGNLALKIRRAAAGSATFGRVKLEIGTAATGWQARPVELQLCQRYFFRRVRTQSYDVIFMVSFFSAIQAWGGSMRLPVTMRVAPTVVVSAAGHFALYVDGDMTVASFTNLVATQDYLFLRGNATVASGSTFVGAAGMFFFNNSQNGSISFDAEL